MAHGAHDNLLYVQVVADETWDAPAFGARNVFRFRTTDGNGKDKYSNFYQAGESMDAMYELSASIDPEQYRTSEECNALRGQVRRALKATVV